MKLIHLLLTIISIVLIIGLFMMKDATSLVVGSSLRDNIPEASQESIKEVSKVAENNVSIIVILSTVLALSWISFSSYVLYKRTNKNESNT